jgi:uncharacterized protein YndB with AHSA1/START domain
MRKKILIALGVIAVVLAGLAGVVAMQPADFRIVRSATIPAPPAEVFAQVNDFHNWEAWSPWKKLDPAAKNSFEGAPSGTGAVFKWVGNSEVGEGSMTITESRPNELIRIRLHFVKPFEDTSTAEFTFKPEGQQTLVTWSMYGRKDFIGKAICMFMDMDKMVGGNFEEGLANIKTVLEAKRQKKEGA